MFPLMMAVQKVLKKIKSKFVFQSFPWKSVRALEGEIIWACTAETNSSPREPQNCCSNGAFPVSCPQIQRLSTEEICK